MFFSTLPVMEFFKEYNIPNMRVYLSLLFICLAFALQAQGTITVEAQPNIEAMMQRYTEINRGQQYVDGWRIQLVATTDRQKVEREKQRFQDLHPGVAVDWTHVAPYYRLRAGAFITKLEATQMMYRLKRDYSSAYPVKDKRIQPSEVAN